MGHNESKPHRLKVEEKHHARVNPALHETPIQCAPSGIGTRPCWRNIPVTITAAYREDVYWGQRSGTPFSKTGSRITLLWYFFHGAWSDTSHKINLKLLQKVEIGGSVMLRSGTLSVHINSL
jgi:hypothetical protein